VNARDAIARLQGLGVAAVTTADASAVLGLAVDAASHTLQRLALSGLLTRIRKGIWALGREPDRRVLLEYITAPFPAYLSLQTALYQHGLVEQVPEVVYAVSLARGGRVRTPVGTYSIHHVQPEFFGGFEVAASGAKLATAEKALIDLLYLSPARSWLFAALPEVELPRTFRRSVARSWARKVPSARVRAMVESKLEAVLQSAARE